MKQTKIKLSKVFDELFDIFDKTTKQKIGKEKRGSKKNEIFFLFFDRNCTFKRIIT